MHVKKFKAKKRTLQNQMVVWYHSLERVYIWQLLCNNFYPNLDVQLWMVGKKKLWIHVKVMVYQLHSHMSSTSCGKLCGRKRTAPWDRADYLNVKDTNGIHSWTSQVQSLRKVVWMMFAMLDLWELLASHLVWNFWICHWRNKFSLIKFANNAHTTHIVVKPRWTVSRWRDWIRGYWSKLVG